MPDAAWVALSLVNHIGAKKMRALLRAFGDDPQAVLDADAQALQGVPDIGPKIAASIRAVRLAEVQAAIPRWEKAGVRLLDSRSDEYPERLKRLEDAPPTLFARGAWRAYERAFAVVGTRQPSADGERMARSIGHALASRGIVVVSGLALGIDRTAHLSALAAPEGWTLAVLGSGVLNVYPERNRPLANRILKRGALVSEVHPSASPAPAYLVARNRLISGLSDGVIVVETGVDGGAMHAARRALEQGRAVYAVDLPAGGNQVLIAEGARVIDETLNGII